MTTRGTTTKKGVLMNTSTTTKRSLSDTAATLGDLFDQGMRLSLDLLETLSASSISTLNQMISPSSLGELLPKLKASTMPMAGCGCRIPQPCWAPQPIGEVACHICPGGTATIRLRITNCGATRRDIRVEAAGKADGVTVMPS